MALERNTLGYTTPSLGNVTAKVFQSAEHIKTFFKNEVGFPVNKYEDLDKYSFHPSNLFWSEADVYYSSRPYRQQPYVKEFLSYDPKAPLRGNFKRTEVGMIFAQELGEKDLVKPGDAMTTPKQYYVNIYQDSSRPIDDIHLRVLVDDHMFDFIKHYNTHEDYFRIQSQMFNAIYGAVEMAEQLFVDAFLLSLFGGFLHSYPVGSPCYRFFAENNQLLPDDGFSKLAKEFYDPQGEIAKTVKEIANWTTKTFTSKKAYLTNIVRSEIPASKGKNLDVPKFSTDILPDFSDKDKALQTAREWYLEKEPNEDKWKKVPEQLRRTSLMALGASLSNVINRMQTLDIRNHAAYNHYSMDQAEKLGIPLRGQANNLMVFMNYEDYTELAYGLIGSPAAGMFTERPNTLLQSLESQGVKFYGLNFIMPGCAAIIDRLAFTLKEFFVQESTEVRQYHLVTSRIKHVKKKPVMYEHVIFEALCPAKGQKFVPGAGWASENLPLLVKDA